MAHSLWCNFYIYISLLEPTVSVQSTTGSCGAYSGKLHVLKCVFKKVHLLHNQHQTQPMC